MTRNARNTDKYKLLTKIIFSLCVSRIQDIRNILESYENHIREHLCESADLKKPITVKLFSGLQLNSHFVPEHKANAPFGNNIEVGDRIRVTARTGRYFTRKLNEEAFNN